VPDTPSLSRDRAYSCLYSPECVEDEFSEVPLLRVLGSSAMLAAFATMGARRSSGERAGKEAHSDEALILAGYASCPHGNDVGG
jgi:hypothetical protein